MFSSASRRNSISDDVHENATVMEQRLWVNFRGDRPKSARVHVSRLFSVGRDRSGWAGWRDGVTRIVAVLDHRQPLSRGGDWSPENLALACESCNAEKRDMTEQEFCHYMILLATSYQTPLARVFLDPSTRRRVLRANQNQSAHPHFEAPVTHPE
jgi:hypothetical protein